MRTAPTPPYFRRALPALLLVAALGLPALAGAQSAGLPAPARQPAPEAPASPAAGVSAEAAGAAAAADGFRGIRLGMTVEEVKAALAREPLFSFRGDRDVSLLPSSKQTLIEVPGRTFVERGYFQFHDGRLLVMIVMLAREEVSYFDVYTRLRERYGATTSLDPSHAVWELPATRLSLEKPVVLKYVDRVTFEALRDASRAGRDYEELTRLEFLRSL